MVRQTFRNLISTTINEECSELQELHLALGTVNLTEARMLDNPIALARKNGK